MARRCTCEEMSNGVIRGQPDPPAPPGRLHDPKCPKHGLVPVQKFRDGRVMLLMTTRELRELGGDDG